MKIILTKSAQKKLKKKGLLIIKRSKYKISDDLMIEAPCRLKMVAGNLKIGSYSYLQTERLDDLSNVEIGRYCSIAENVKFNLGEHPTNWLSSSDFQFSPYFLGNKNSDHHLRFETGFEEKTIIGHDVWIGDSVLIKNGVKIGNGAVIGAGAIVTKDIPAYAIAVGIPARVIRYRFNEDIIEKIEDLKWWDYNHLDLKEVDFRNIEKAISQIEKLIAQGLQKYQGEIIVKKDFVESGSFIRRIFKRLNND